MDGTPFTESEVKATITEVPVEAEEVDLLKCDVCGFEAKSNAGLAVHRMKHKDELNAN